MFNLLCSLQPSASTSIIRERVWRPEPQLTLQRDHTSLPTARLPLCAKLVLRAVSLENILARKMQSPSKTDQKKQEALEALQKTADDRLKQAKQRPNSGQNPPSNGVAKLCPNVKDQVRAVDTKASFKHTRLLQITRDLKTQSIF